MEHKAFGFDWDAFESTLRPHLLSAQDGRPEALVGFVRAHLDALVDPDEGGPLTQDAVDEADSEGDVDYLAEMALTRFYDSSEDVGLGADYLEIDAALQNAGLSPAAFLLGRTIEAGDGLFDPGKMGTYFCTKADAEQRYVAVQALNDPKLRDRLERFVAEGVRVGGLYITF